MQRQIATGRKIASDNAREIDAFLRQLPCQRRPLIVLPDRADQHAVGVEQAQCACNIRSHPSWPAQQAGRSGGLPFDYDAGVGDRVHMDGAEKRDVGTTGRE
jgi:hypothetical protein